MNILQIEAIRSIEGYLNPEIFGSPEIVQRIGEHLTSGRLAIIQKALKNSFAERMYKCLDECEEWQLYEDYRKQFHYHHHNLYREQTYPPDLKWCNDIFCSNATKAFFERLSHRDCSAPAQFSASWFLPGDYSLPHNDRVGFEGEIYRQIAFVWHLTKDWQINWGGDLYWCATNQYISPSFNTLFLFQVNKQSQHFVTAVSPYARSKRMAINGWWTGKDPHPGIKSGQTTKSNPIHPLVQLI